MIRAVPGGTTAGLIALLAALLLWGAPESARADNIIVTADATGSVGQYTSMELDAAGNPVVSYYDGSNSDLKILHCGNPTCTAGNWIKSPDTTGIVGLQTSLDLDASGYPIVAYLDNTTGGDGNLKVMHCNDANCDAAVNGAESITSPATIGDVGHYPSIALRPAFNTPVVSYHDNTNGDLVILSCGNANCTSGNAFQTPDTTGDTGEYTSLTLDNGGNPVIAYHRSDTQDLKFVHCADPGCSAISSLVTVDSAVDVGREPSIVWDSTFSRAAISYMDVTNFALKVALCGNSACNAGNTLTTVDPVYGGQESSVALDANGYPVISYWASGIGLRVIHCGSTTCISGNVISSPDVGASNGRQTSIALDSSGNPVVSYWSNDSLTLQMLHCATPVCTAGYGGNTTTTADATGSVGQYDAIALDSNGNPAVSYLDFNAGDLDLRVLRCGTPACSGGNTTTSPDTGGSVGATSSIAIDASGNPVVSYWDATNNNLKVLHCGNLSCTAGNTITAPDQGGQVSSLELDVNGFPVISHFDADGGALDLKVIHCGDATCSSGNTLASPDTAGIVGENSSLELDSSGFPVISYGGAGDTVLKLLHCGNDSCTAGNSIQPVDTVSLSYTTSLALDGAGNPVIAYYDVANFDLKVAHCDNPNCSGTNVITSPDNFGDSGQGPSLALDAAGHPIISYFYQNDANLRVLHCGNPDCTAGNSITQPDANSDVGATSALALDAAGNPVIAYWESSLGDLKVLHCGNPYCAGPAGAPNDPTPTPTPVTPGTTVGTDNVALPFNGDGPAATRHINSPTGLYETGGANSLYFAETGSHIVRKYTADGNVLTLAGRMPTESQTVCNGNPVGDGCTARQALLLSPRDVFVAGDGTLYIADKGHCRVRKVLPGTDGIVDGDNDEFISTVAGNGTCTYSDGGGVATSASLNNPSGIALDDAGNLYIADTDNNRIRKVTPGGTISTIAGTGTAGSNGDNGLATAAQLRQPQDVFMLVPSQDDLVIADTANNKIRRINFTSGIIYTLAGTGTAGSTGDGGSAATAQLSGPQALAVIDYTVFIADTANNQIRRVDAFNGEIDTFDFISSINLTNPQGVAVGGGLIGVSNTGRQTIAISHIDPETGEQSPDFTPTQSCGSLPGISSIDWGLPIVMLGLLAARKRLGSLFVTLATFARHRLANVAGGSA